MGRAEGRYAGFAGALLVAFLLGGVVGIGADRWISTHPLSSALPIAANPAPTSPPAPAAAPANGSAPPSGVRPGEQGGSGASGARSAAPTPGPTQAPPTTGIAATTAEQQAIQQVIQKGDDEQAQAIAGGDPTVMQDTATLDFYQEQVRVNQDLTSNGVTAIKLTNIDWGQITVNGTSATATAWETWSTTYDDGTTEQSRDQNVYTLVQQNGAWKVSADDHPDDPLSGIGGLIPGAGGSGGRSPGGQTSPGLPGLPGLPGQPAAPSATRVPRGQSAAGTSRNWAGYAATGGTFTSVSGTWTVPPFAADATAGADAAWVGIGGVRRSDLIQAGTQQTVSGTGSTQYEAWVETLPRASHPVQLTVNPGDSVTVSIAQDAQTPDQWQISFKNNTTGQTFQATEHYTSSLSSAEWVEEAPSGGRGRQMTLDHFGSVAFSGGSAVKDGQTVNIAGAGAKPITMAGRDGQALVTPSALGADGASFTVTQN